MQQIFIFPGIPFSLGQKSVGQILNLYLNRKFFFGGIFFHLGEIFCGGYIDYFN